MVTELKKQLKSAVNNFKKILVRIHLRIYFMLTHIIIKNKLYFEEVN